MIDIHKETLLSIFQVTRLVPPTREGRATHSSTVIRWILRGVRGRRLEAVRIGGNWYTSVEALARFAEPAPAGDDVEPALPPRSSRSCARRANDALDRFGL